MRQTWIFQYHLTELETCLTSSQYLNPAVDSTWHAEKKAPSAGERVKISNSAANASDSEKLQIFFGNKWNLDNVRRY